MALSAVARMPQSGWLRGTVARRVDWTESLFTLTVDAAVQPFRAGQFLQLGLDEGEEWASRTYSVASAPGQPPEFYVALVQDGLLTPGLHRLAEGDPVGISSRAAGHFTLERVPDAAILWAIATGTGLGPFIAMLRTEEPWARFGRVALVHGVRRAADLSYQQEFRVIADQRDGRLIWVPVVSREPGRAGVIHGRIPQQLDAVEAAVGAPLAPETSQILLCGNPEMVGEMEELLAARGLRRNRPRAPGHVTTERYW